MTYSWRTGQQDGTDEIDSEEFSYHKLLCSSDKTCTWSWLIFGPSLHHTGVFKDEIQSAGALFILEEYKIILHTH